MGRNIWIVKPGSNSKGSGIECMSTLPDLLHHCDTMPNRVVQKYIERPLLLFSGRKFDIRQWVLVRSVAPLRIFLFSECYLRLCNDMYDLGDLRNRERHISNWQVNKHGKNVVDGACASLQEFRQELKEITGSSTYWEDKLLPQMKHIVIETMRAVEGKLVPRDKSFELYGFDVMVDENMKMWLLEANLSPACEGRTPFLNIMLSRMAKRLIEVAILGQEAPDGEEGDWVKICDDAEDHDKARSLDTAQRTMRDLPYSVDLTIQGQQLRISKRERSSQTVASQDSAQLLRKGNSLSSAESPADRGEAVNSSSSQSEPLQLQCGVDDTGVLEPVSQQMIGSDVQLAKAGISSTSHGQDHEVVDLRFHDDVQRLECECAAFEQAAPEPQSSPIYRHKLSFDEASCDDGEFEKESDNQSHDGSYESEHSEHASSERDLQNALPIPLSRQSSFREDEHRACEFGDVGAALSSDIGQHVYVESEEQESMTMNNKNEDSVYASVAVLQQTHSSPELSKKTSFDEGVCGTAESGSTSTTQSPRAEHDAYSEFEDDCASDRCSSDDDFET